MSPGIMDSRYSGRKMTSQGWLLLHELTVIYQGELAQLHHTGKTNIFKLLAFNQ